MVNCKSVSLVLVSFFALAVFFGLYASSASIVFAFVRNYTCGASNTPGKVICCTYIPSKTWCTKCDNTKPPSNCSPRYSLRTTGDSPEGSSTPSVGEAQLTPTPNAAPPLSTTQTCPDGSAPDATGKCLPITQGPKESPSSSQRAFSPTGGCVPGGTTCIPCDPGLAIHGANCIPSGDWHPSFSTGGGSEGGGTTPPKVQPPAKGGAIEQPPSSNAPSPPPACPDGSAPDANGNCPTTNTNQNPQPSDHHKPKGSDLGQQLLPGDSIAKKGKKGNTDNSPTPPACPDKGPIPPDCTLKPKF